MAQAVDAARRVASIEGLTTAAGFAIPAALAALVPVLFVVWIAAVVGYYFAIIHHVGAGHTGLPGPSDARDDLIDTVGLAVRGVLCAVLGTVPLLVWVRVTHRFPSGEVLLVLLLAGQTYMPAALLAVAFSNRGLAAVWPVAWVRIVTRAPLAYVRFVATWVASVALGGLLVVTTRDLLAGVNALLGNYVAAFIWTLYSFVQAAMIGNHVRHEAAAYGWD